MATTRTRWRNREDLYPLEKSKGQLLLIEIMENCKEPVI